MKEARSGPGEMRLHICCAADCMKRDTVMLLHFILIPSIGLAAVRLLVNHSTPMVIGLSGLFSLLVARSVALRQDKARDAEVPRLRALIIGVGTVAKALAQRLESGGIYQVVGFVGNSLSADEEMVIEQDLILGERADTLLLVKQHDISDVFVACAPTWQQQMAEQLATESPDVLIRIVPSYYESMMRIGDVESLGDIALVRLQTTPRRITELSKRTFDVAASSVGLILLSPLIVLVYLLIKATSAGPAVFRQERVGRYGRPFRILKFRTMRQDAERETGPILSEGASDERLTRFGRWLRLFRIDEVPQLWNVLIGEMSLVGPRPERTCFVRQFEQTIPAYATRHQVQPGITGLAQICGGYHTDASDKLRFDLIYISQLSIWFDLAILFRTVMVVLLPRSVGAGGSIASKKCSEVGTRLVNRL